MTTGQEAWTPGSTWFVGRLDNQDSRAVSQELGAVCGDLRSDRVEVSDLPTTHFVDRLF